MTALVHNSSVDGDDQGSCQKTFSERQCSWFPGGQAIWVNTAAVSLFSVSLSTSYRSRWKRATTAPFRKYCCFGRSNSQHFHRETTKIQGRSLRVPDWIFYLGKTTEHKLGVLEACLTAWVTQKIPSIPKLAFSIISRDGSLVWSKERWTSLTKK